MDSHASGRGGLILTAAVLGGTFAAGRDAALFFAQTGSAAWMGILLAAVLFGVFAGTTAALARCTGARSYSQMFGRLLGRYAGSGIAWLHGAALLLAAALAVNGCGRACARMLPLRSAIWIGAAASVLLALALAANSRVFKCCALMLLILFAALLSAMLFMEIPEKQRVYAHVELKLGGNIRAALLLGTLYGFRCCTLAASMIVRDAVPRIEPLRYGACAGGSLLILLLCANAALQKDGGKLIALQDPFAVLLLPWGKTGYFLLNGISFLSGALLLAGMLRPYAEHARK